METTKKSLLIFLAIVVVGGSAYGAFYLLKKYTRKSSEVPMQTTATTTVTIPGFTRVFDNKVPKAIPEGLITEKSIVVLDSFTQDSDTTHQATFRYVTKRDRNENFFNFNKVLYSKGWVRGAGIQTGGTRAVRYSFLKDSIFISYSLVENIGDIVDITIVTQDK